MNYESPEVQRLVKIVKRGQDDPQRGAILWVGAGMSIPAGYPSWGQLAEKLREASFEDLDPDLDPLQTIDAFVEKNGRGLLAESLSDIFEPKPHRRYHERLMQLPWSATVTTNYDELLEDALNAIERRYMKVTFEQNLDLTANSERLPLYKIHGDIANFKRIILAGKSYETYRDDYPLLNADFESTLRKHGVVFFGCSLTDERLLQWLENLGPEGRPELLPSCAVITEDGWNAIPSESRELLEEANIKPLHPDSHEQIPELIDYLVGKIVGVPSAKGLRIKISVASEEEFQWKIVGSDGSERVVDEPWKNDTNLAVAFRDFWRMSQEPADEKKIRAELHADAVKIGDTLGELLLDEPTRTAIEQSKGRDGQPPLLTLESDDDLILSLPWELMRDEEEFLLREARIDLARTVPISENAASDSLKPPDWWSALPRPTAQRRAA